MELPNRGRGNKERMGRGGESREESVLLIHSFIHSFDMFPQKESVPVKSFINQNGGKRRSSYLKSHLANGCTK